MYSPVKGLTRETKRTKYIRMTSCVLRACNRIAYYLVPNTTPHCQPNRTQQQRRLRSEWGRSLATAQVKTHLAASPYFAPAAVVLAVSPPAGPASRGHQNRRQQFVFILALALTANLTRCPSGRVGGGGILEPRILLVVSNTTGDNASLGARTCVLRLQHRKFLGFGSTPPASAVSTAIDKIVGSGIAKAIAAACWSPLAGTAARVTLARPTRSGHRRITVEMKAYPRGVGYWYVQVVQEMTTLRGVDALSLEPEAAGGGGEVVTEGTVATPAFAVQQQVPARLRRQRGIAYRLKKSLFRFGGRGGARLGRSEDTPKEASQRRRYTIAPGHVGVGLVASVTPKIVSNDKQKVGESSQTMSSHVTSTIYFEACTQQYSLAITCRTEQYLESRQYRRRGSVQVPIALRQRNLDEGWAWTWDNNGG